LISQARERFHVCDWPIFNPAHHCRSVGRVTSDVQQPKTLLPEGYDVAPPVFTGLMLKNFRATANVGHFARLRIDSDNAEALIGLQYGLEQHPIARFKNMKGQKLLWEQHDVR
jgi:hypothetical protein